MCNGDLEILSNKLSSSVTMCPIENTLRPTHSKDCLNSNALEFFDPIIIKRHQNDNQLQFLSIWAPQAFDTA